VFTGVAFLLTACKMGSDYTRPETPKADSWRVTVSTAESIANLPWWELLKDQELQRLVRMALAENLDLQIAAANIEEFQAQLMIGKFDLVPSLNYSAPAFGFRNTNSNVFPIGGGALYGAMGVRQSCRHWRGHWRQRSEGSGDRRRCWRQAGHDAATTG
jgi:outer membrane protein TolC